jgi:hypothetical protein
MGRSFPWLAVKPSATLAHKRNPLSHESIISKKPAKIGLVFNPSFLNKDNGNRHRKVGQEKG